MKILLQDAQTNEIMNCIEANSLEHAKELFPNLVCTILPDDVPVLTVMEGQ